MTSPRQRTLLLPKAAPKARRVFRQRRRRARWQQLGTGLLSLAGGAGLMFGLMLLPERLDTLLLVSNAIANLIGGLSRFGMGLLQLVAVLALAAVALGALVLLLAGVVRLLKALWPEPPRQPPS
jgi:hypothetical protein